MFDEPFADSSQIPTHLVARLARRHVKVALSGDGGDELFAGYSRYRLAADIWRLAAWWPAGLRGLVARGLRALPLGQMDSSSGPLQRLAERYGRPGKLGHKVGMLAQLLGARDSSALYRAIVGTFHEEHAVVLGLVGGRP
jgi:asparagine synthase (glutamine-hydrolysing)